MVSGPTCCIRRARRAARSSLKSLARAGIAARSGSRSAVAQRTRFDIVGLQNDGGGEQLGRQAGRIILTDVTWLSTFKRFPAERIPLIGRVALLVADWSRPQRG